MKNTISVIVAGTVPVVGVAVAILFVIGAPVAGKPNSVADKNNSVFYSIPGNKPIGTFRCIQRFKKAAKPKKGLPQITVESCRKVRATNTNSKPTTKRIKRQAKPTPCPTKPPCNNEASGGHPKCDRIDVRCLPKGQLNQLCHGGDACSGELHLEGRKCDPKTNCALYLSEESCAVAGYKDYDTPNPDPDKLKPPFKADDAKQYCQTFHEMNHLQKNSCDKPPCEDEAEAYTQSGACLSAYYINACTTSGSNSTSPSKNCQDAEVQACLYTADAAFHGCRAKSKDCSCNNCDETYNAAFDDCLSSTIDSAKASAAKHLSDQKDVYCKPQPSPTAVPSDSPPPVLPPQPPIIRDTPAPILPTPPPAPTATSGPVDPCAPCNGDQNCKDCQETPAVKRICACLSASNGVDSVYYVNPCLCGGDRDNEGYVQDLSFAFDKAEKCLETKVQDDIKNNAYIGQNNCASYAVNIPRWGGCGRVFPQ